MDVAGRKLFISYGRLDALDFVDRLVTELTERGYDVWRDTTRITPGSDWQAAIEAGIGGSDAVIAVLTPHAVRRQTTIGIDGVCLDEIAFARFGKSRRPVVPIMVIECEIPFSIFRLSYIDARRWRDNFQGVFAEIESGLAAALSGAPPALRQPDWPVPLDQGSYLAAKRSGFVGRSWLFDEVARWLHSAPAEPAMLIVGDPGVGKSAFVGEFAHRNHDGRVLAYHFCTREDRLSLEPGAFVVSLAAMLASRVPSYASVLDDSSVLDSLRDAERYPGRAVDVAVIGPLSRLPTPANAPLVLLVDALDEAMLVDAPSGSDDATIVGLLASRLERLPSWLRLIVTARRDPRTLDELGSLNATVLDAHSPQNLGDVFRYVDEQVHDGAWSAGRAEVVGDIAAVSDGNFLYAKSLLRDLARGQVSIDEVSSLPRGMAGFYSKSFRRLLSPENFKLRAVLEVLVAAQAPLDMAPISAIVGDTYEVASVLRQLAEFVQRRDDGFVLFHRSLADWLQDPQNAFYIDGARGHLRFATDYAATMAIGTQIPERPFTADPLVAYRGRYGLDHLSLAGMSVDPTWNPWAFADTVLAAREPGYALGAEIGQLPVFSQRYCLRALHPSRDDVTPVLHLVDLLARASRTRYHDGGVLRIDIAADGTWTQSIHGEVRNAQAINQALSLTAWAGAVVHALLLNGRGHFVVKEMLGGLSYLARGLDVAGWAQPGLLSDRGGTLADELEALVGRG